MAARPDGSKEEDYMHLVNFTYAEWAWEFLRRNEEFISACRQVELAESEEQDVADLYGLQIFKPYKQRVDRGIGRPKFQGAKIKRWGTQNTIANDRTLEIKLTAGQVLIRFDLSEAVNNPKVLTKQLSIAKNRLEDLMRHYATATNVELRSHHHKISTFGLYLRLLDGKAAKKSNSECFEMLFPKEAKTIDRAEISGRINKRIKSAKEYASIKYMHLAMLKGRPKNDAVVLSENKVIRRKSSVDYY